LLAPVVAKPLGSAAAVLDAGGATVSVDAAAADSVGDSDRVGDSDSDDVLQSAVQGGVELSQSAVQGGVELSQSAVQGGVELSQSAVQGGVELSQSAVQGVGVSDGVQPVWAGFDLPMPLLRSHS
jgi:hypothetical protein